MYKSNGIGTSGFCLVDESDTLWIVCTAGRFFNQLLTQVVRQVRDTRRGNHGRGIAQDRGGGDAALPRGAEQYRGGAGAARRNPCQQRCILSRLGFPEVLAFL